jgi:hypothetical protein
MRAVIGGHVFNDVVQFNASFEMNTIPEASLTVSVGRRVDTQQAATIHAAIRDLKVQVPAAVYLTAIVTDRDRADPGILGFAVSGGKLIFEGYAVGTGWQRSNESANFTLHLSHWLSQLHYASALNPTAHPGNPGDWQYPSIFEAVGSGEEEDGGAGVKQPSWVPGMGEDFAAAEHLSDIWGKILHPWLRRIALDPPFDIRLQEAGIETSKARQQRVLNLLQRIGPNKDGVPLAVDLTGGDGLTIAAGICDDIAYSSGHSWLNTTLWGKVVGEWSQNFWFAMIPRVSDSLVVPFAGPLQGRPWATIRDTDYAYCEANAHLPQVLRAVGIVFPATSATNFNGEADGAGTDLTGFYGLFAPPASPDGLVLVKNPPRWLCNNNLVFSGVEASTGEVNAKPIESPLDPAGTGKPNKAVKPVGNPKKAWDQGRKFADRYAQQWYTVEMLKGRIGELSGKLRFDIAPGSNVLIEAGVAKNVLPHEDALTESIYATVTRVSMAINAENGKAGTAFSIAHIRTAAENQSLLTSIPKPPLYQKAWYGARLVN